MVKLEKVLILTFTKSMKAKALETKNIHKINTEVRLKRHTDFRQCPFHQETWENVGGWLISH